MAGDNGAVSGMTPADARALTSAPGRALLAGLPPYEESAVLPLAARLREAGHDPGLVAAALTQARLRARAAAKLGPAAAGLLLTTDGLEQATRPRLAALHARRFVDAGVREVWDLGCGLGLDAAAFADAGLRVLAVDADEATAALAAENLRDRAGVRVRCATAQEKLAGLSAPDVEAEVDAGRLGVWFDPARRLPGRTDSRGRTTRTFRLDQLSPPWELVLRTAASVPAVGAKLSPGFPHARVPDGAQAQWVSYDGEVLECALWWGATVRRPGRMALVVRGEAAFEVVGPGSPPAPPGSVPPEPGVQLYDPDRAVVRAGRVDALAVAVDGAPAGPDSGYVLAETVRDVPWARRFVITQVLPSAPKAARAALRARGIGRVTIKKRGTSIDPEAYRAKLRLDGRGESGVLVLTSGPRGSLVLLVEPAPGEVADEPAAAPQA